MKTFEAVVTEHPEYCDWIMIKSSIKVDKHGGNAEQLAWYISETRPKAESFVPKNRVFREPDLPPALDVIASIAITPKARARTGLRSGRQ